LYLGKPFDKIFLFPVERRERLLSLLNNIRRYAIYRKLLVSYLLLVLLSILMISAVLYLRFSYQSEAEINRYTSSTLEQMDGAASAIQERVVTIGNELLQDPELITAMHSGTTDPLLDNEVAIKLRNVQAVYSFIEYISVYNGNTGRYLNHRGITKAIDGELIERIERGGNGAYMEFIPRRLDLASLGEPPNQQYKSILSYILYSNFSNLIPKSGAIVIHVNEEKAIGELTRSLAATTGNEWMVLDRRGIVISHSDPSRFLNNLSSEAFVRKLLASDQKQGRFKSRVGGAKFQIHFARSADTGWIMVDKRPYKSLFLGLDNRLVILWAFVLLLTVIGVLFAFRLAGRMYRPYSAFQNEQSRLEASWRKAYPLLQESYLRGLLKGQGANGPADANPFDWRAVGRSSYSAIVVKIDDYRHFVARPYKEQDLIRFAIRNITDEMLGPYGTLRTLEVENDHLVILVQFEEPKLSELFLLTLIELQQTVRQYFHVTVSMGIGDAVETENAFNDSYRSALDFLKYRLFLGHGSAIDRQEISPFVGRKGEYPSKTEVALLEAIRLGHKKEADKEIDRFLEAIRLLDYKYAFVFANQLVISVQKQFENALSFEEGDYETHGALLYSFSELETLQEIGQALKSLSGTVIDRLEEKRANRNLETIDAVLQLIRASYNDPNLSLEWAAERMHYSSGHLSKLFKQATGQSFNDYVNATRLLRESNESAAAISEKVGLGSTYFFTLFKKTYGMTPAQYRLTPSPETGESE